MTLRSHGPLALLAAAALLLGCRRHHVAVELPAGGRALSAAEQRELQEIADAAFRDVRAVLPGSPPRLALILRWGKDVIAETGETGTASLPAQVAWTMDPDRDVLATIRTQLRPTLFHELHHLARKTRVTSDALVDRVVTEGLATAFERDFAGVDPPWGRAPPEIVEWTRELLRQPEASDRHAWLIRHPDGRRWIGMRVGTFLVDRASRASRRTPADLVFAPASEIVALASVDILAPAITPPVEPWQSTPPR